MNNKVKEYIDNPRRLKRLVISPEFELIDNQFVQGINLDKETLEDVFEPLITESQYTNIIKPVKECLMSAENLTKDDIALVIITGGMSNFYIVEEKLNEFFEGKVPVVTVDTTTSVSKGAAIDAYNAIDSNISLRKMDIKDRLAEDIYLRDSKGFKLLISRHQLNENIVTGEFDYVIDEDNLLKVPVFLYYGQDINCVEDFTPIQGKMISLSRQYKKGDILKLKWHMDKNQVIRISIEELGTEIVFEDNCSGKVQGRKDYINQFSIN